MTAEEFLARLQGVRPSGKACIAHEAQPLVEAVAAALVGAEQ